MQVTGNHFWMQGWAQNPAQQKANARVNPLLEQVQSVLAQKGGAKAADAASKEMDAKLLRLEEESRIDPADKALSQAKEKLMLAEQEFYGAMHKARSELRDLVDKHEAYTNILNGTADYEQAVNDWYIDYEDRDRFSFTDFDSYLVEKGYQGDGTKEIDFLNTTWIAAKDSMGIDRHLLPGQVLVKGSAGTLDQAVFEDQLPLYEQWQADKKAHQMAELKAYAAEKLPQVQKCIDDFPMRLNSIAMQYAIQRAEIIEKLPEGVLTEEYLENLNSVSALADEIKSIDPGNGKAMLDLLNRMMEKQQKNVVGLGGVANDGFSGRLKNGRLPQDLYA